MKRKPGDTVTAYYDPQGEQTPEGQVTLIRLVQELADRDIWEVEFTDEPGEIYRLQLRKQRKLR